jgi:hypothetical protein
MPTMVCGVGIPFGFAQGRLSTALRMTDQKQELAARYGWAAGQPRAAVPTWTLVRAGFAQDDRALTSELLVRGRPLWLQPPLFSHALT